jgi:AraC-like DNA-binding protein
VSLTFAAAQPDPALRRYVLGYFLLSDDHAAIADEQRADVGGLTFVLDGHGHYHFAKNRKVTISPVTLNGPTTARVAFRASGPLRFLVVSLQPEFWTGLALCEAHAIADDAWEAGLCLRDDPEPLRLALAACKNVEEMAPQIDAYLTHMITPLPDDQRRVIGLIRNWLLATTFPEVSDLYEQSPVSERHTVRLANRYFGAPPKVLSRKYGALRTASDILKNGGEIPSSAFDHYADHSHLIREVKRFTGLTPRQLMTGANPIMRITLNPVFYRELEPVT